MSCQFKIPEDKLKLKIVEFALKVDPHEVAHHERLNLIYTVYPLFSGFSI